MIFYTLILLVVTTLFIHQNSTKYAFKVTELFVWKLYLYISAKKKILSIGHIHIHNTKSWKYKNLNKTVYVDRSRKHKVRKDREQKTIASLVKFGLLCFIPQQDTGSSVTYCHWLLLHHNNSIEELQKRTCDSKKMLQKIFVYPWYRWSEHYY